MPLTVTSPFDGHAVGDTITDADAVAAILASEAARFVVRTGDDTPDPAPDKAPTPAKES